MTLSLLCLDFLLGWLDEQRHPDQTTLLRGKGIHPAQDGGKFRVRLLDEVVVLAVEGTAEQVAVKLLELGQVLVEPPHEIGPEGVLRIQDRRLFLTPTGLDDALQRHLLVFHVLGAPGNGLAKLGVLVPGLALLDIQVLPLPGQPRHFRLEPVILGPHFSPSTNCGALSPSQSPRC